MSFHFKRVNEKKSVQDERNFDHNMETLIIKLNY